MRFCLFDFEQESCAVSAGLYSVSELKIHVESTHNSQHIKSLCNMNDEELTEVHFVMLVLNYMIIRLHQSTDLITEVTLLTYFNQERAKLVHKNIQTLIIHVLFDQCKFSRRPSFGLHIMHVSHDQHFWGVVFLLKTKSTFFVPQTFRAVQDRNKLDWIIKIYIG